MTPGETIVRWTIRSAVALYLAALAVQLWRRRPAAEHSPPDDGPDRWLWSGACLLLLVHVAAAFHVVHHWSHTAALRSTARDTLRVTGFDWGGGIYFNYALMVAWLADVAWWWLAPISHHRRPRVIGVVLQLYLLFMMVNATIVFASGPVRWLTAAALASLVILLARTARRTRAGEGRAT
jgi:hypothetical protein